MERLFLMFLDHTQRRSTVGVCDLETSRIGAPYTHIYIYIYTHTHTHTHTHTRH